MPLQGPDSLYMNVTFIKEGFYIFTLHYIFYFNIRAD